MKGTGAGEGLDQCLFTDDDISSGLTTYEYYLSGHPLAGHLRRQVSYWKSNFEAPHSGWLADSINNTVAFGIPARSYSIYSYDSNGNKTDVVSYFPGDDGLLDTADDYMTAKIIYSTEPTISGQLS